MNPLLFSLSEIIDILITVVALGFIFQDYFSSRRTGINIHSGEHKYDPIADAMKSSSFDKQAFFAAAWIVGVSVIIHEFAHKFVAMFLGFSAVFKAQYFGLAIGVVLKLIAAPFIVFVPAYVSITGNGSPFAFSLVALAGPFVHLVFWIAAAIYVKQFADGKGNRADMHKYMYAMAFLRINKLLFIFNMLPIPGFDGFQFYRGLYLTFF